MIRIARFLAPWLSVVLIAATTPALAAEPQEDPPREPPVGWAIGAGVLTAMVPLSAGAALFATAEHQVNADLDRRKAATLAIAYGLALSPIVSHLVVREWSRAAIFGAIPLACAVGMTVLLQLQPSVTFDGTREGRLSFGLLMSFTTLAAAAGLADTYGARGRARERRKRAALPIIPTPFAAVGGGGLGVAGAF